MPLSTGMPIIAGGLFILFILVIALWLAKHGEPHYMVHIARLGYLMLFLAVIIMIFKLVYQPSRYIPGYKDAVLIWFYGMLCGGLAFTILGNKMKDQDDDDNQKE